ncbi:single-stranded DNA-binding protein [Vibrio agarivorans]|uniref:Single-stranded DNA-binding protein n=1 Tax=Vibrio agarivorans TaxID=153622 RepID=A0ABT7Y797_9VIBR|nr:single-stranded DNA-binding protein [Vibrio agarivorans]MDN2483926.1 single-stranded DNA-binding protein [Vibrio agarivorans]
MNKVTLKGGIVNDPELRFMPSGAPLVTFRLATKESWRDKVSGEWKEKNEYHNVVLFDKHADVLADSNGANMQYLKKGTQVRVEGMLTTRNYDGPDGAKKYVTEVKVDFKGEFDVLMRLRKPSAAQGQPGHNNQAPVSRTPNQRTGHQPVQNQQPHQASQGQNANWGNQYIPQGFTE